MVDLPDNGKNKGRTRNLFVIIICGLGVASVIALILVFSSLYHPSNFNAAPSSLSPSIDDNTTSHNFQIIGTTFDLSICGEYDNNTTGSISLLGTGENPIPVYRNNNSQVTVPLCIRSNDADTKTWNFVVVDPDSPAEPPKYGIHASLDKTSVVIPPQHGIDYSILSPVLDKINLHLSADSQAVPGVHIVLVQAEYSLGSGQTEDTGKPVYVDVK